MHEGEYRRVACRYVLAAMLSFLVLPAAGAFPQLHPYAGKQYISDLGLSQLYDDIVRDSNVTDGLVGVGIIHLETGRELYLNRNERFPMASAVKVPVAVQMMRLVDQNRLRLDSLITVRPGDISPGSGVLKNASIGKRYSLQYLMEKMLTISDNSATDIIFRTVGGPGSVHRTMITEGIDGMSVDRPIYLMLSNIWGVTSLTENDPFSMQLLNKLMAKVTREQRIVARRQFFSDERDTSTPEAMARLLEKIWRQEIISPESSRLVLDIMGRSHGNHRIKGLLPPGTKVYHKTGTITGGLSDVGIVELPNDTGHLVVVVFVKGGKKPMHAAEQTMALIARDAFNYFQNTQAD